MYANSIFDDSQMGESLKFRLISWLADKSFSRGKECALPITLDRKQGPTADVETQSFDATVRTILRQRAWQMVPYNTGGPGVVATGMFPCG